MDNVSFGDIRYNAALGAFEARVDISRGGRTFRYPCRMNGPLDLTPDKVRAGLARHAMRMSDSGDLRSVL
ncbi:orotidine 5'-phosphate decarboxylase [Pelagovum pacificum]|uniref:Orotidine 5'-phosphate decarboxylase n=1 Tax=Pelagovum pacificum TaxID=2588711 RepID=A0A5C5GLR4_9RHOB|nr:orotidine 5'-phosphate decarboxylase [Pelagovum pacificum]QQA42593.1 orotidine 5'-phosphate decarboxylase [Pelagovum pacificum]TNY34256.1 orotidine 5'-phosphate decarboxylase [Pelagovum pacificum]